MYNELELVRKIKNLERRLGLVESKEYFQDAAHTHVAIGAVCVASVTNQAIVANGVWDNVDFDTEEHDTDGMFTATSDRLYARTAGYYLCVAGFGWGTDINYTQIRIEHMDTTRIAYHYPEGSNNYINGVIMAVDYFTLDQYVTVSARHGHATNTRNVTVRASFHRVA